MWQRFEYDAAGRLKRVTDDAGNWLQDNGYGASREKIFQNSQGVLTWYVWGGDVVISEYTAASWGGAYTWAKSYVYAGSRLLSTFTNNGAGESLEFHHPDRLGTKVVTNNAADTLFEQSTLPFGTAFAAETTGSSNRLFTTYDRSPSTGLDYAVNRTYSPGQGRFTQVDPIGMGSVSVGNPQSFNLYAYVQNAPTDSTDPTGLFEGPPFPGCLFNNETGKWECPDDDGGFRAGGVGISEQIQIENGPEDPGPTNPGGGGRVPEPPGSRDCNALREVTVCMLRCLNNSRPDLAAKPAGDATGIEGAGDFLQNMTWTATAAAFINQGLNIVAGSKPRWAAIQPNARSATSWQRRVFGKSGIRGAIERVTGSQFRLSSSIGKVFGRVSLVLSAETLVFEGAFATGYFSACASTCGYRAGENYEKCLSK